MHTLRPIFVAVLCAFAPCLLLAAAQVPMRGAMHPDDLRHFVERVGREPALQQISVPVILEGNIDSTVQAEISAAGAALRYSHGKAHEINIPAGRIAQFIGRLPANVLVRFSYPHKANQITGQGVALTGAANMQAVGTDGAGVKVGVIDLGFAGLANSQASGDLPAGLTITDYTGTGTGGIDHGTSVAEIVHEMAPGAQMYLAKISTDVQLQQATNDMIAAGVRVINHSVGWYGAAFYDGTGSICATVDQVETNGIIWVNSMGNDRYRHYLSTFTDADVDLRNEFSPGKNYNTLSATAGSTVTLILNWDAYSGSTVDYNLYLYNGNPDSGGVLVASSHNTQGPSFPSPYEAIDYTAPTTGIYYIVVKKAKSSTLIRRFTLFSLNQNLDINTTASSLAQPADCHYVVSVGASDLNDNLESFSSEGPTTDGRNKPEVDGPDRVATSRTTLFAGTSASAPHVAGATALLRAKNSSMSASQIRALLESTANVKDLKPPVGYDFRSGFGRISLDADGDGYNHDSDNCPLLANPTQADLDNDGLGDACDPDIDGDGLTNTQEPALGTDPYLADTDGDGLSDGQEVNSSGTNPLLTDTDGDGLTDGQEVLVYHTNPLSSDKGDLAPLGSGDGVVNLADLLVLSRYVEGLASPGARDTILGDMNNDGVLDVRDVLLLQRRL